MKCGYKILIASFSSLARKLLQHLGSALTFKTSREEKKWAGRRGGAHDGGTQG